MRFIGIYLRCLLTVYYSALFVTIILIYQAKDNFSSAQKAAFNAILLFLILFLGVNYLEASKELVNVLKDPIKSRWGITQDEANSLDSVDYFMVAGHLVRTTASPKLRIFCIAWISINLAMELAIGLTSLTYTVNDGTTILDTYIRDGSVNMADLSCYHMQYLPDGCPNDEVTKQTVAHTYGEMNLAGKFEPYEDIAQVLSSQDDSRFYWRRTRQKQQLAYRFKEYNPEDTAKVYPYLTKRYVTAEALNCRTYRVVSADDKDPRTFIYADADDGENGNITIPLANLGREGTTYIYRAWHPPPSADVYSCGTRCVKMWAYKNPSGRPEPDVFYECPVNISRVINASQKAHEIPDDVAKYAAASIALQGRWSGQIYDPNFAQYQFYASGSAWEIHHKEADQVGENFAKFALGSLATMASLNPFITIPGQLPILGHRVQVYMPYFAIVISLIVTTHLVISAATIIWANRNIEYDQLNELELAAAASHQDHEQTATNSSTQGA